MRLGEEEEGHDRHDSFLNADRSALSVGYDVLLTKMAIIQNTHLHPRSFATKPPMTGLLDWLVTSCSVEKLNIPDDWAQEITSEEYRHHKPSFRQFNLISNTTTTNIHWPGTEAPGNKPKDNKRSDIRCKGATDRKPKCDNITDIEQ